MSQDNSNTASPIPMDPYTRRVMDLANATNRLHGGLEQILEIEEWKQAHFLDTLTEIETWLDAAATRQEKRLEYVRKLPSERETN